MSDKYRKMWLEYKQNIIDTLQTKLEFIETSSLNIDEIDKDMLLLSKNIIAQYKQNNHMINKLNDLSRSKTILNETNLYISLLKMMENLDGVNVMNEMSMVYPKAFETLETLFNVSERHSIYDYERLSKDYRDKWNKISEVHITSQIACEMDEKEPRNILLKFVREQLRIMENIEKRVDKSCISKRF